MKTEVYDPICPTRLGLPLESLRIFLSVASETDREGIYRLRHEVYARELGQHAASPAGRLRDALDDWNIYLVARIGGQIAGFISLTPPPPVPEGSAELQFGARLCTSAVATAPDHSSGFHYSIDKYVSRDALPFRFDDGLYEIRLLTVVKPLRGGEVASLLMYAAFRWVEAHGGTRIVAIGRRELMPMYLRTGLEPVGLATKSGAVDYDLLTGTVDACRDRLDAFGSIVARLERRIHWRLAFPFRPPAPCFHGGASFEAIGAKFDSLDRFSQVINADVLDA